MLNIFRRDPYLKKIFYTFSPKWLFLLDPHRFSQRKHWKEQDKGDNHGYDNYTSLLEKHTAVFLKEVNQRLKKDDSILDLGCNCAVVLNLLKENAYKRLAGVDLNIKAIEYGKNKFDLKGVELMIGSYEEVLPRLIRENRKFDLVYSAGASISLVHPSFDIIRNICQVTGKYVILLDEDNLGFAYPRLWEYEFNRWGFTLVKLLRPSDGRDESLNELYPVSSLMVFRRIKKDGLNDK